LESEKKSALWLLGLLGILGVASYFRSKPNAPPKQPVEPIQTQDNTDTNRNIGKNEDDIPSGMGPITETPETKAKREYTQKRRQAIQRFRKAGGAWLSLGTFVVVLAYAVIARNQWQAVIFSNELTQQTLNISQQAYVTVGRPDGTVAEIIMPTDLKAKAAILVYFQNTGHLPARFNWGNNSRIVAILPSDPKIIKDSEMEHTQWSEFDTDHSFTPMVRTRNRKQASSFGWSGTITIAGQSAYEGILWEIPKERMLQLMTYDRPFMPDGKFEYCDGFGHRVCRRFMLRYAGNPYNKLFLASEEECTKWEMQVLNPDPNLEYLNPCELSERREELKFGLKNSPEP
jgi:hypothetical protein